MFSKMTRTLLHSYQQYEKVSVTLNSIYGVVNFLDNSHSKSYRVVPRCGLNINFRND